MSPVIVSASTDIRFALHRLEVHDGRLVVEGQWSGVGARRFMRPVLLDDGRRHLALLDGKPWPVGPDGAWSATFDLGHVPRGARLQVAPDVEVVLRRADGRPRRTEGRFDDPERISAARAEAQRLRAERAAARPREAAPAERVRPEPAAPRVDPQALEAVRGELAAARDEVARLRKDLQAAQTAALEAEQLERELTAAREALERLRHDDEAGAALERAARYRHERYAAQEEAERLRAELEQARRDDEAERLRAELADQHRVVRHLRAERDEARERAAAATAAPGPVPAVRLPERGEAPPPNWTVRGVTLAAIALWIVVLVSLLTSVL